jgi:hypothetical protein
MNLELLQRPFSAHQIRRRKTSLGTTLDYIETHTVIARLNEAFKGQWSFRILEHKFLDDDVVVLGELAAEGVAKQQFGTCELHQETEDGMVLSMGDALKAAASDALKKAATLFGVGLQLYGTDTARSAGEKEALPVEATPSASAAPDGPEAVVVPAQEAPAVSDAPDIDAWLQEAGSQPAPSLITDMQMAEIIDLARKRNFSRAQVDQRARSRYGRDLKELTQDEAQDIIEKLKGR